MKEREKKASIIFHWVSLAATGTNARGKEKRPEALTGGALRRCRVG
jgi:hypothetical protein